MNSARSQNPFLLVLLVVSLLGLLSLLRPGLTVAGMVLRPVRLLADIVTPEPQAAPALLPPEVVAAPPPTPPLPADSALVRRAPQAANPGGLVSFLAALRRSRADGRPVRIAYFGDSMIEGDLITSDLRNSLQEAFGGAGVGFVPIQSVAADFRGTVQAQAGGGWRAYTLVSGRVPVAFPLGISGHVFVPRVVPLADSTAAPPTGASWVQFRGGRPFARVRHLGPARLLYGPGAGLADQVRVTADGRTRAYPLRGTQAASALRLPTDSTTRQLRLAFATHAPRPVYGVSFESGHGITLDNFSFRGSNGMSLAAVPFEELAAFGPVLDYRLIILHYGVNITDVSYASYNFYERAMTRVIDRLQRAFPNASILVVGMSDKSTRLNGEFITNPAVPRLLAAQRRLAQRTHAAFWNLFEAMGGQNAMVRWVEESPALANRDYTHVNARGAHQIADLLYAYLMQQYQPPRPAARPHPELDSAASQQSRGLQAAP